MFYSEIGAGCYFIPYCRLINIFSLSLFITNYSPQNVVQPNPDPHINYEEFDDGLDLESHEYEQEQLHHLFDDDIELTYMGYVTGKNPPDELSTHYNVNINDPVDDVITELEQVEVNP